MSENISNFAAQAEVDARSVPSGGTAVDICAKFGVSTANADNSTAINLALSTLGPLGLEAFISKPGIYPIQNPIIIGNGTSSTFSTWSATLVGAGMPAGPNVTAVKTGTVQTTIQWQGTAGYGDAMLQIIGPLGGWGVRNLCFDGGPTVANAPAYAWHQISANRGRGDNLAFANCSSGIWHDAYSSVSGALTGLIVDDIFNQMRNISLSWANKAAGYHAYGLRFDGGANAVANTCFNKYDGLWISSPSSSYGGGAINDCIYFKKCDSNRLHNLTFDQPGGTDTYHTVFYDWTGVGQWPKDCIIDTVDFAQASATVISSTGSPSGSPAHNRITNISAGNGIPNSQFSAIPYLMWDNVYRGTSTLVAGTATVTMPWVVPGSFIAITRLQPGGTMGNLSLVRNTGNFVVTSDNGVDTSSFLWECRAP